MPKRLKATYLGRQLLRIPFLHPENHAAAPAHAARRRSAQSPCKEPEFRV